MTKNWITYCIILELNPLVTQSEGVTQSSNLGVAMNSNFLNKIVNWINEIIQQGWYKKRLTLHTSMITINTMKSQ